MKLALPLAVCLVAALVACTAGPPSPKFAAELKDLQCEATPPPPRIEVSGKESMHLIAMGDTGLAPDEKGSHLGKTLDAIRALGNTDAILLLGDNVYECGLGDVNDPNWAKVIAPLLALGKPVYPVLGNHDWGSRAIPLCGFSNPDAEIKKSGTPGFEQWIFPARNYVVHTPSVEIVLYDSSPIAEHWPEDMQRSLCALRKALGQPKTTPWRIVVAHHPLHSCGEHGAQQETVRMQQAVEKLLQESGVDLYVSGHDHDLEMTTGSTSSPLYLVSGAGSETRKFGATCTQGPTFKIQGGFAALDVTADTLSLRVFCNGQHAPCMTKDLSRGSQSAGLQ